MLPVHCFVNSRSCQAIIQGQGAVQSMKGYSKLPAVRKRTESFQAETC